MIKPKHISPLMTKDTELVAGLALKYDASNPNGYETPTQLNARDVVNRARGNHTGTQLADTISDLAATVRSVLMSGISFATATAVTAADNILVAIGKLQAQITANIATLTALQVSTTPQSTARANAAGTSTAAAKADHTHNTVIDIGRIYATTAANTSGTGYTAISGFSWIPNAGSYTGDFNCAVAATTNNTTVRAALFKNGVQITESEMEIVVRSGAKDMISGGCTAQTFNGTTDSIEMRVSASAGTVTVSNRILKLTRVG